MTSLQRRLVTRIALIIGVAWLVALVCAKFLVWKETRKMYFHHARIIAINILDTMKMARELGDDDYQACPNHSDRFIFVRRGNQTLYKTANSPQLYFFTKNTVFTDEKTGEKWLVSSATDDETQTTVWVGLKDSERKLAVRFLIAALFFVLLLIFSFAIIVMYYGVRTGLKPLDELAQRIDKLNMKQRHQLPCDNVPQEIKPMVQAINDLMDRLSDSLAKERVFLDSAAHELRTPITALKAQVQSYIASDAYQPSPAIKQIEQATLRVELLTTQLLDWARVQSNHCQRKQSVDVTEVIRQVLGDLISHELLDMNRTQISIVPEETFIVTADPSQLEIIIRNLIENALRYNDKATILINMRCELQGSNFLFIVEDNGPGIEKTHLEHVTQHFYRVSPNDQKGTGLGLGIVSEIIESNRGKLILEKSEHLEGLSATVFLPR